MQRRFDSSRELLKLIAIATMTVDHIGAILYPEQIVFRLVGRLSFPLICYLLVLGMESTSNIRNYFIRLFVFGLLSQVPFSLALGLPPFEWLNIFFTLSFGVIFIQLYRNQPMLSLLPFLIAHFLNFDYDMYGIAMVGCMYALKENEETGIMLTLMLNLVFSIIWSTQALSLFALPIILLYKRGRLRIEKETSKEAYPLWKKYFFYVYYPLHLTVLYLLKRSL